jgi:hypothetical protein
MLTLSPYQVCHYGNCPCQKDPSGKGFCQGTNPNRNTTFQCSFVSENGSIDCGACRSIYDKTGTSVLLQE